MHGPNVIDIDFNWKRQKYHKFLKYASDLKILNSIFIQYSIHGVIWVQFWLLYLVNLGFKTQDRHHQMSEIEVLVTQ